ncbi:radical SAM protein [Tistrella mobilis]|uniref:B12-binding domain-containing radical SAM protein n=1 Tax=Tistrella mobilis TaxID=171437 RepID=UPI00355785B9
MRDGILASDVGAIAPIATESAVLRTLAYHQVFGHPLAAGEVWDALDSAGISFEATVATLTALVGRGIVETRPGLDRYWIAGLNAGTDLPARRLAANSRAADHLPRAQGIGRRLMRFPFIDAVAISGSLSKGVLAEDGDYDFFVVTRAGRLWIARSLMMVYARCLPSREWLCTNYVVDRSALVFARQDLFTATELATLVPVGGHHILAEMQQANGWAADHRPNMTLLPAVDDPQRPPLRRLGEALFAGPAGNLADRALLALTRWHLRRRIPDARAIEANGSLVLDRHVFKGHTTEWKYRTLQLHQAGLDAVEARIGAPIDRRTTPDHVLFASAYFYRFDPKQWQTGQPYPPLGTLYAAAVAREAGFAVSLFDAGLALSEYDLLTRLEADRPAMVVIHEDGFNYLTKMCLTRMREAALRMAGLARAFGARVAVASSDATDNAALYLDAGADAVIRGESEATLREVLEAWRAERPLDGIAGVTHRRRTGNTEPVIEPPRRVTRDLDELPDPAWDLVDLAPYREIWTRRHGRFSLNLTTTRGCPYSCNWCAKPIYGNRYNSRSPERVVDEIARLIRWANVDHFWITDDIFGLKPGWVQRFDELIKAQGLRFRYTIQSRADLLLRDATTLDALASSGLETAWIGAESGSQTVLDAMDKGITRGQIDRVVPALRARGIQCALFLQFGYPGETREDIGRTIAMVEELLPDQIGISVSYPLPGTVFHDRVHAALGHKTNWTDSDDLDLMFPGTYSPEYYRQLHRYMHHRFGTARARAVLQGRLPEPRRGGRLRGLGGLARNLPRMVIDGIRLRRLERPRTDAPSVPHSAEEGGT